MSKSKWLWLGIALSALLPHKALAALTEQGVENRMIIRFKPGLTALDQRLTLEAQGLSVLDEIPRLNVVLAEAPAGKFTVSMAQILSNSRVMAVEPDVWRDDWINDMPASLSEAQAAFKQLPKFQPAQPGAARGLLGEEPGEAQWGIKRVNAPAAWPTNQGDGVNVAVIDTGIYGEHPDLKNRVQGGYNAIEKNANWNDDHFHGTHVAGIIAAELDGKGVVGVAPQVNLYAVKVLTKEGKGDLFAIMDGISWCAQNGIQVANMSLGAPQAMPMLQYALQDAVSAGVTFVAATGNDGKAVNWPAAYPESIAVSALCPPGITQTKLCPSVQEGIATFSSRGPQVAFIAPGVLIPSSVPPKPNDPTNEITHAYSGTSMATPHVAGLAAMAVAKITASGGKASPDAVRRMLQSAAEPLGSMSRSEQGAGLINAAKLAR